MSNPEYLGLGEDDGTILGRSSSHKVAFYGTTPITQRAGSVQSVTHATVASSASFGATHQSAFNSVIASVNEIIATLTALGAWKGGA